MNVLLNWCIEGRFLIFFFLHFSLKLRKTGEKETAKDNRFCSFRFIIFVFKRYFNAVMQILFQNI